MYYKCEYYQNIPIEDCENETVKILKKDDPLHLHKSFAHYSPTPIILLKDLSHKLGIKELWVKDESKRFNLQAFKVLGASYAIHKFLQKNKGNYIFCTATDGNHGTAVAWASKLFHQKAKIFVPEYTVNSRIKKIENEGAKVVIVKGNYDKTVRVATEEANKHGYHLIQDTSWKGYTKIPALITAGYTTIFREMENIINLPGKPEIDMILIQAGVGSLASAAVYYYRNRYQNNCPRIICVEPTEADCLLESVKHNKIRTSRKSQRTIMTGLNCGTPSLIAWQILKRGVDLFISIPDPYTIKAMQLLYYPEGKDVQILSGESGAAGLGGLIALLTNPDLNEIKQKISLNKSSKVLIFNTEGITDPIHFNKLIKMNKINHL